MRSTEFHRFHVSLLDSLDAEYHTGKIIGLGK